MCCANHPPVQDDRACYGPRGAHERAMNFTNGRCHRRGTSSTERSHTSSGRTSGGQTDRAGWNDLQDSPPRWQLLAREVQPHDVFVLAWPERGHGFRHRDVVRCSTPHPGLPHHISTSSRGRRAFWTRVIKNLRVGCGDNRRQPLRRGGFETMCRFCAGKPLVYYSRTLTSRAPALFDRSPREHRPSGWS